MEYIIRFLSETNRIVWLRVITVLGFLTTIAVGFPLWVGERSYPHVPVFEGLFISPTLEAVMYVGIFLLLTTSLVGFRSRILIALSLALLVLFVLLDLNRFQAWIPYFGSMLLVLAFFSEKITSTKHTHNILNTARFVVVALFFWAGVQKIGPTFFTQVWPYFVGQVLWWVPTSLEMFVASVGYIVPFFQIAIAVGLLFPRTRTLAIGGAFVILIVILLSLGPLGHVGGVLIWPWNIALFLSTLILFKDTPMVVARNILWVKKFLPHTFLFVFIGMLPALNYVQLWDNHASWHMHSGRTQTATIFVEGFLDERLGDDVRFAADISQGKNGYAISLHRWALVSLHAVPYPEKRAYQEVFHSVCEYHNDATLTIIDTRSPLTLEPKQTTYDCGWVRKITQ